MSLNRLVCVLPDRTPWRFSHDVAHLMKGEFVHSLRQFLVIFIFNFILKLGKVNIVHWFWHFFISSLARLPHLSQRLTCELIGKEASVVVHSLYIFPSETTGPIKVKFHIESKKISNDQELIHIEHLWDGGTKVCSNGPGHMTKLAAMPISGKNLKKSSSLDPKGWWPWNLVSSIGC